MEIRNAFAILGIEETKEDAAIKNAYRQKLRLVNPEDDPEGFKRLREAYETAAAFAAKQQPSETDSDDSPSGLFVQKAAALYASIEGRQDADAWEALFKEPAFLDLEEEENCREKLLAFLMNHCYFPTRVWAALDKGLQIVQDKQKLYEKFPKDFIDYAVRKILRGEDFEFEQLTGRDDADLDGWIFLFSKAGREEADKNYASMEETIREAEAKEIDHPGLKMMKARMLWEKGDAEAADGIVEDLLSGVFKESLNVRYQSAEYFWNSLRRERAAALYLQMKEENPKHYMANRRLARWYLDQGQFSQAKVCVNVILAYPLDEEGKQLVDQINENLERELKEKLRENPRDLKTRMDLGWCYLQSDRAELAIELMSDCVPAAEQEKDYANLMGKVYYYAKQYEKAKPVIERWAVLLKEQMPQGGQEREDDCERLATAHSMLSQIYMIFARDREQEQRDPFFEAALKEIDRAKQSHENPGQEYTRAQIYLEWDKYEECIGICDNLKEQYPDFDAAIILHQKASAKLYDASGVLEDYFALRRLAPDYAGSWELAAEVYYQLKRTEDLEKLLEEAESGNVMTAKLKKYRFLKMADQAHSQKELAEALEYGGQIGQALEEEEQDNRELSHYYGNMGECCYRLGKYKEALTHLKRAVELNEENAACCTRIVRILKAEIENTESLDKMDEALSYADLMVRHRGSSFDYIERGLLYALAEDYPAACEEFEQAAEKDQKDPFAHSNLARMYRLLNRTEEALEHARQAVACAQEDPMPYHYEMLSCICRQMHLYEEALAAGREIWDRFPEQRNFYFEDLISICNECGKWEEALSLLKDFYPEKNAAYVKKAAEVYCYAGLYEQALHFAEQTLGEDSGEEMELHRIRAQIFWYQGKLAEAAEQISIALKQYQDSLKCRTDRSDYPGLCSLAADIYFYQGNRKEAARWAGEALEYYRSHGGFEKWLNPLENRPARMYDLGKLQLYAGHGETAMAMAQEMKQHPRCITCIRSCCIKALELEAGVCYDRGEFERAVSLLEQILKEKEKDPEAGMKLALLRRSFGL